MRVNTANIVLLMSISTGFHLIYGQNCYNYSECNSCIINKRCVFVQTAEDAYICILRQKSYPQIRRIFRTEERCYFLAERLSSSTPKPVFPSQFSVNASKLSTTVLKPSIKNTKAALPNIIPPTEPTTPSTSETSAEPTTPSTTETSMEPTTPSTTERSMEPTTSSTTERPTEPTTSSTTERPTEPTTPSITETSMEPTTSSTTETSLEPTTSSTTETSIEPTSPSTTETSMEPSTPSTTKIPTEPSTPSTSERPTEPSTPFTIEKPTESSIPSTTETQQTPSTPSTSVKPTELLTSTTSALETPTEPSTTTTEMPTTTSISAIIIKQNEKTFIPTILTPNKSLATDRPIHQPSSTSTSLTKSMNNGSLSHELHSKAQTINSSLSIHKPAVERKNPIRPVNQRRLVREIQTEASRLLYKQNLLLNPENMGPYWVYVYINNPMRKNPKTCKRLLRNKKHFF